MIGAGNPPSTFIQRQIDILGRRQVKVVLFPEFSKHKYLNCLLCKKGITAHLSHDMTEAVKNADIIHFQWPTHLITFGSIARKFRKPVVLSLRGRQINILPYMPYQEKYVHDLKRVLPLCDAYHCVSEDIMEEAANFGLRKEHAWINRPAVDTTVFSPLNPIPDSQPLKVAMVGALIWRKGYEYGLLAFKKVLSSGLKATLLIAGDGPERGRVEYTVHDLGLSEHVQLLGKQSPEAVRDLLRSSQILLHASLSEGIANVVLEGMACGLPVVATDAGGLREALIDGREGFLVPPRDVAAMAHKLALLLGNEELRHECGKAARARAVEQFDIAQQGDRFVAMYKAVLAK